MPQLLLIWLAFLVFDSQPAAGKPRVLRMGYEHSPPVQLVDARHRISGPVFDALSQAAARRGIQLQWVFCPQGPDKSLLGGSADLWPLMADLPERREHFRFSPPYMRTKYWVMTRKSGNLRDLAMSPDFTVVLPPGKLAQVMASRYRVYAPHARLIKTDHSTAAVSMVCRGEADATLIAQGAGEIFALRQKECSGNSPRLHALPGAELWFGIGFRKDDRGAAQAARLLHGELLQMYAFGVYPGLRGLCDAGLAAAPGFTPDCGEVRYPRMLKWLRD